MNQFFSSASHLIKGSPIDNIMDRLRDIREDTVYFSVGSPSASNIPVRSITETTVELFATKSPTFLNYEEPEGNIDLRRYILNSKKSVYGSINLDNLLITSGCTQGFDLCCRLFLNQEDVIIIEDPTYCISFSTAETYGASIAPVPIDENGIIPSLVEERILTEKQNGKTVKMMYVIPNAQNPSGVTLTLERRLELISLAKTHNILIIEDDPYGELMFEDEPIPSLFSLDESQRYVIHLNSFSKIIAPGFRTGWMVAHPDVLRKMTKLKHSLDSCTNSFGQSLIAEMGKKGCLTRHVHSLKEDYHMKKERMRYELRRHFSTFPDVTWTNPKGGMFLWMHFPHVNTDDFLAFSASQGVVFIPGSAFHPSGNPSERLRLCYSSCSVEEIEIGIERLASIFRQYHAVT
jgi:2-aminoadipate transaminase